MTGKGQAGFLAVALAHELGFRIGRRLVRFVSPALTSEVGPTVTVARTPDRALRFEALQRRPRSDQSAVDREMFVGNPALLL